MATHNPSFLEDLRNPSFLEDLRNLRLAFPQNNGPLPPQGGLIASHRKSLYSDLDGHKNGPGQLVVMKSVHSGISSGPAPALLKTAEGTEYVSRPDESNEVYNVGFLVLNIGEYRRWHGQSGYLHSE